MEELNNIEDSNVVHQKNMDKEDEQSKFEGKTSYYCAFLGNVLFQILKAIRTSYYIWTPVRG